MVKASGSHLKTAMYGWEKNRDNRPFMHARLGDKTTRSGSQAANQWVVMNIHDRMLFLLDSIDDSVHTIDGTGTYAKAHSCIIFGIVSLNVEDQEVITVLD
jgi:hypothetical protein